VETVADTLVWPAGMKTSFITDTDGSDAVRAMYTPPEGAGPLRFTVTVVLLPPLTVVLARTTFCSVGGPGCTVNVALTKAP